MKWSLDAVVGWASGLGVAREESELDVDVALTTRDGLVELLDVAASP